MSRRTLIVLGVALAALATAACGPNGDGPAPFFELERADVESHEALPVIADLPGEGWEITGQDDFGDDDDDGFDFEELAAREPACAELTALSSLGGFFGGEDDEDDNVAQAQIEFSRAEQDVLPTTVETEIEVKATVAEVQGAWGLARAILEADETQDCMVQVIKMGFGEEEQFALLEFEFEADEASAEAPRDGASMAFRMGFKLGDLEVTGRFEMYFWPLGNAQVSVFFFAGELERDLVATILAHVDERIVRVAGR